MLAAAASLGLLLAAGEAIRWNAGLESQARGRNEPSGDRRAGIGELDLHARLGLSEQGPDLAAALTYSPSFLFRQVAFGEPAETGNANRHGGRLELQTRLAPTTRLSSRTAFDWGLTDFSPLSGQVTPLVVGLLPSHRFVRTLDFETMLDLAHAFSRRLQLSVAAGLQRSGGVGHDGVSSVPFQVGPRATASLAWAMDRANAITLLWSGSESRFSIDRRSLLSDLQAGWRLRASSHTLLDAAAGVVFVHSSGGNFFSRGIYGSGAVGVGWNSPVSPQRTLQASLRFRLLPGVDRLTALAIQTVRAEAGTELTGGRLRLGVSSSGGHAISGVTADDLRVDARASWITAPGWSVEAGLGAAWTNQVPFAGWQVQTLVGLRWAGRGSL